ncbi:hypothetical protein Salat_0519300 [Sesamum alatum]|uniref:Uncharacterized protein n=1 Tax=Sesamum alatum TaxID=300844 RepID=A0AAE2D1L1_9LAMI|nr:hypothetical protein Salat_0519300 [Sesamum alatum]
MCYSDNDAPVYTRLRPARSHRLATHILLVAARIRRSWRPHNCSCCRRLCPAAKYPNHNLLWAWTCRDRFWAWIYPLSCYFESFGSPKRFQSFTEILGPFLQIHSVHCLFHGCKHIFESSG